MLMQYMLKKAQSLESRVSMCCQEDEDDAIRDERTHWTPHFLDHVGRSFSKTSVYTERFCAQPTARRPEKWLAQIDEGLR